MTLGQLRAVLKRVEVRREEMNKQELIKEVVSSGLSRKSIDVASICVLDVGLVLGLCTGY